MSIIDSGKKKMKELLTSDIYYIPDYQRPYSWIVDEQIVEFYDDLLYAIDSNNETHFFGQIVVHENKEENRRYIIDGQQRVTSVVIFLSALKDCFKVYGNQTSLNRADDILRMYIGRSDDDGEELKLYLGETDKLFFKKFIQLGLKNTETTFESHNLIKLAYEFFFNKISQKVSGLDKETAHNEMKSLFDGILDKLQVIFVVTDNLDEAFIIFETLNSRGKSLETSDLLKNFLLRKSESHFEEVKRNWNETITVLNGADITNYLRHYWNSHNEFTREKALFRTIRSVITSSIKCKRFANSFSKYSSVYKMLLDPLNNEHFSSDEIRRRLNNLKIIGASSYYPVVLALVQKKFNETEIEKVLWKIEALYFRNCVVSGYVANKYELDFAKLAFSISNEEMPYHAILEKLSSIIINDEIFKSNFLSLVLKGNRAKYVLRELNDFFEDEVKIIIDGQQVHLEHIMPQKPGEHWKVDEGEHNEYLHMLGNLTLLGKEYNNKIKNYSFKKKKETYEKSKIQLTLDLVKFSKWEKTEIVKRQHELFEKAKIVWPR